MGLDLFEPVLHGVERGTIVDSIGHYYTHCSSVISLCDCLKSLLPSSIPNLHSNLLPVDVDSLDLEVDA